MQLKGFLPEGKTEGPAGVREEVGRRVSRARRMAAKMAWEKKSSKRGVGKSRLFLGIGRLLGIRLGDQRILRVGGESMTMDF